MEKKEKTVEEQAAEFLERERLAYDARMTPIEPIDTAEIDTEEDSSDESAKTDTKTKENNQGE